jgi:hypothetical protein
MDKIIVAVDEEGGEEFGSAKRVPLGDTSVIICPIGVNGEYVRGFNADYVFTPEDTDREIVQDIFRPMVAANNGKIVYY